MPVSKARSTGRPFEATLLRAAQALEERAAEEARARALRERVGVELFVPRRRSVAAPTPLPLPPLPPSPPRAPPAEEDGGESLAAAASALHAEASALAAAAAAAISAELEGARRREAAARRDLDLARLREEDRETEESKFEGAALAGAEAGAADTSRAASAIAPLIDAALLAARHAVEASSRASVRARAWVPRPIATARPLADCSRRSDLSSAEAVSPHAHAGCASDRAESADYSICDSSTLAPARPTLEASRSEPARESVRGQSQPSHLRAAATAEVYNSEPETGLGDGPSPGTPVTALFEARLRDLLASQPQPQSPPAPPTPIVLASSFLLQKRPRPFGPGV